MSSTPGPAGDQTQQTATASAREFIGYCRVSTGDQMASGLGMEAQRSAIVTSCVARGWPLGTIYEDAASGSAMTGRPGLAEALDRLGAGQARGLIVAKLDRLSRSLVDFAGMMSRAQDESWALVALDLGVDTTSPAGEMMANVMASFANYERRLIGMRTREALAVKRAQGVKLGRPKSIDSDVMEIIYQLRDAGMTFRAMADKLNSDGVPTGQGGSWHAATISRAIKSRADSRASGA